MALNPMTCVLIKRRYDTEKQKKYVFHMKRESEIEVMQA